MKFRNLACLGLMGLFVAVPGLEPAAANPGDGPRGTLNARTPQVHPETADPGCRANELLRLANEQNDRGDREEAIETLNRVRTIGKEYPRMAGDQGLLAAEKLGWLLTRCGRNQEAVAVLEKSAAARRQRGERQKAAVDLNSAATTLLYMGKYEQCVERAMEAQHVAGLETTPAIEAQSQFLMGYVNRELKKYPKALEHFRLSQKAAKEAGDDGAFTAAINEEGNVLFFMERFGEAIERKREAIEVARANGDDNMLASCEHDMANILAKTGRHQEALEEFRRAYATFVDLGSTRGQSVAAFNTAGELLALDRPQEAIQWLDRAMNVAPADELPTLRAEALELLAKVQLRLGRYRQAFETLQKAQVLRQRIHQNEASRTVDDLERRFKAELRQAELEHARQLQELELRREQVRRRAWTGAFVAAALVLLLLVRLFQLKVRATRQISRAKAELEEAHERLEELARTDELTGLANRREAGRWLDLEDQRALRTGTPFSVLMLDIDHFKRINDTHGHETGDEVLRRMGEILRQSIRSLDLAARWGGEEFLVGLSGTDCAGARKVAENIRSTLRRNQPTSGGEPLAVTVTCGIATCHGTDTDTCLRRADEALYAGKRAGRNRVMVAEEPAPESSMVGPAS